MRGWSNQAVSLMALHGRGGSHSRLLWVLSWAVGPHPGRPGGT